MNTRQLLIGLMAIGCMLAFKRPTAKLRLQQSSQLVSLKNDTLNLADLLASQDRVYLVTYKPPYCHDCLPDMMKKIRKNRVIKKNLYFGLCLASPLSQRQEYSGLKQRHIKMPTDRFFRFSDPSLLTNTTRGFLILHRIDSDMKITSWDYSVVMDKGFCLKD